VEPTKPEGPPSGESESFTRQVHAVLLADVTGFSVLMGEDDERTARAVRRLQSHAHGIIAEAGGRSESVAGDALFATFDSVVAAVQAALLIQRRIAAQEFEGEKLKIRIGVHFGDVLLRDGAAYGDAINVAARLQTLAQPGTICMSEAVYRQVRNRFDERFVDLGRRRLKNISDPVHAYLLVPRGEDEGRPLLRRPLVLGGSIAALLVVLGAIGFVATERWRSSTAEEAERSVVGQPVASGTEDEEHGSAEPAAVERKQMSLGVMLFKQHGAESGTEWMSEALRDGLNTQLSGLSKVKVYSKEFIDFLMTRQGLSEMEVANKLGITKMLTGSFVAMGGTLQIETHVVDVSSGVLEASYTTQGREEEFLDLQNEVLLGAVSRLDLPLSETEQAAIHAQRSTNVEVLRMLLEAERGGKHAPEPATEEAPGEPHSSRRTTGSFLERLLPSSAYAEETSEEGRILDLIERYRQAVEAKQLDEIAALYDDFSDEQRSAQERYFQNVGDLRIAIEDVDIAIVGDEAVVSYTRTDDFVDAQTGRPMHVAIRLTKMLRRGDEGWRLAGSE
jgi:adenylate cyclase